MNDSPMEKNGIRYLCYIEFPSGSRDWVVLHWGEPCGLSTGDNKTQKWITFNRFAPKIEEILYFEKLNEPRELSYENKVS